MFNKVILVGHLTRQIELRYTQSSCIGNTAIAVTRKYTNAQGQKAEDTCFIDITFYGKQAETANQYLTKGSKLLVEGRLKFEQWQDNNGQNKSKHKVEVESLEMLGEAQSNQKTNTSQLYLTQALNIAKIGYKSYSLVQNIRGAFREANQFNDEDMNEQSDKEKEVGVSSQTKEDENGITRRFYERDAEYDLGLEGATLMCNDDSLLNL